MDILFWIAVWLMLVLPILAVFHGGSRRNPCDDCPEEKQCNACDYWNDEVMPK